MKKAKNVLRLGISLAAALLLLGLTACEHSSSDKRLGEDHDFGPNDPELYVAFGDSITAGYHISDSEAYSVKLANLLGKPVINRGCPGDTSYEGLDKIYSILDNMKPGYLLILFGVNDLIMGYGEENAANNLRIMVHACQNNKTIPVLATQPPTYGSYRGLNSSVRRLNDKIKNICSDMGVTCVDLAKAFGDNPSYLLSDGLHPNGTGHTLMAVTFYDALK